MALLIYPQSCMYAYHPACHDQHTYIFRNNFLKKINGNVCPKSFLLHWPVQCLIVACSVCVQTKFPKRQFCEAKTSRPWCHARLPVTSRVRACVRACWFWRRSAQNTNTTHFLSISMCSKGEGMYFLLEINNCELLMRTKVFVFLLWKWCRHSVICFSQLCLFLPIHGIRSHSRPTLLLGQTSTTNLPEFNKHTSICLSNNCQTKMFSISLQCILTWNSQAIVNNDKFSCCEQTYFRQICFNTNIRVHCGLGYFSMSVTMQVLCVQKLFTCSCTDLENIQQNRDPFRVSLGEVETKWCFMQNRFFSLVTNCTNGPVNFFMRGFHDDGFINVNISSLSVKIFSTKS